SALDALDSPSDSASVLAIDDLESLQRSADSETLERLNQLVRARRGDVHVLLVGASSTLSACYDGVGQAMKETQTGFLVGGCDYDDLQVLGLKLPHSEATQGVPPGRGFYARRKHYVRIKVAEFPSTL